MALTIVGISTSQHPDPAVNTYSDLPLPSGVQAGDILIFGGVAQNTFDVADTRLTPIGDTNGSGTNEGGIWAGVADGSGDPIGVTMTDSAMASSLLRCGLIVLRYTRILSTHVVENPPNPAPMPVVGAPQAELVFVVSGYGTVNGEPAFPNEGTEWVEVLQASDSTGKFHIRAMRRDAGRTAVQNIDFRGTYMPERSAYALFGLTDRFVAPPCRNIGRGDDLGVGGSRSFPPPKSQQRSGRLFGHY